MRRMRAKEEEERINWLDLYEIHHTLVRKGIYTKERKRGIKDMRRVSFLIAWCALNSKWQLMCLVVIN